MIPRNLLTFKWLRVNAFTYYKNKFSQLITEKLLKVPPKNAIEANNFEMKYPITSGTS